MMLRGLSCAVACSLMWVAAVLPATALEPSATVVTPVFSTSQTAAGQPLKLPQANVKVAASIYDIPPGASLPVHQHPYPRYAYVLEGTLHVTDVETGQSNSYSTGSFIVEMVGRWHQGANKGTSPVKLLVIDQMEAGAEATILRQ